MKSDFFFFLLNNLGVHSWKAQSKMCWSRFSASPLPISLSKQTLCSDGPRLHVTSCFWWIVILHRKNVQPCTGDVPNCSTLCPTGGKTLELPLKGFSTLAQSRESNRPVHTNKSQDNTGCWVLGLFGMHSAVFTPELHVALCHIFPIWPNEAETLSSPQGCRVE